MIWSTVDAGRLSIQSWADEELGLVFDAVTGDTHLLDHSAIEILQVLHTTPVCVERLSQQLADSFAPEDQGRVVEFITASLLKLKGIGLVFDTPV